LQTLVSFPDSKEIMLVVDVNVETINSTSNACLSAWQSRKRAHRRSVNNYNDCPSVL